MNKEIKIIGRAGLPIYIKCRYVGKCLALATRKGTKDTHFLYHIKTGLSVSGFWFVKYKDLKKLIIELDNNEIWNFGSFGKPELTTEQTKQIAKLIIELKEKHGVK